jgi:hypothetical protein
MLMASWHGMICVSSTTIWSQHGKLGYLAIFTLPHFLPHTKFYYILPHFTTSYHILPHLTTSYHILPHSSESYHKRTCLATFTTRFLLCVQQASSEKATAAFEFRMWMHIVEHLAFGLSRSNPQIMIRLFSVPQGRHCGDMW